MTNKMYINVETGSVDDYDGWWYEDETGDTVNAVDRGEVIEVVEYKGEWMEPEKVAAKQAAAALGRLGRAAMTEAQATASRENGKKGGRPRKTGTGSIAGTRYILTKKGMIQPRHGGMGRMIPAELHREIAKAHKAGDTARVDKLLERHAK